MECIQKNKPRRYIVNVEGTTPDFVVRILEEKKAKKEERKAKKEERKAKKESKKIANSK